MIRIGTRASKLARIQTNIIVTHLHSHVPDLLFKIVNIASSGDKSRDKPIEEIGDSGVFVKELEDALLQNQVDIVVHSLKDLPTSLAPGLILASVSDREDPHDVLICKKNIRFKELKPGSTVATSSTRRAAQLSACRNDLKFVDIRGNVPTRIRKHDEGACDAIVLAAAGLNRLDLQHRITEFFPLEICIPAVGQGALAAECRADDLKILSLLQKIDDPKVRVEITAERAFLGSLGGGCSVPIGALATLSDNTLSLKACIAGLDGKQVLREELTGPSAQAEKLGHDLATIMHSKGANEILCQLQTRAPQAISPP